MLAKMTAKHQLTLPKAVTEAVDLTEYFEVEPAMGKSSCRRCGFSVPTPCAPNWPS